MAEIKTKKVEIPTKYLLVGNLKEVTDRANKFRKDLLNVHTLGVTLGGYDLEIQPGGFKFGCKTFKWTELDIIKKFLANEELPEVECLQSKNGTSHPHIEIVGQTEDYILYRQRGTEGGNPSIARKTEYKVGKCTIGLPHNIKRSGKSIRTGDGSNIGTEVKVAEVVGVLQEIREFLGE